VFRHFHPYPVFIPEGCRRLIVGTLPPPRFSTGELRERDVDFCYGSADGNFWPLLAEIYKCTLRFDNSRDAVRKRKELLASHKIGIADIVESCLRARQDAADTTMMDVRLRDLVNILQRVPNITQLLFMGGNSRNGPEYFFRQQFRQQGGCLHLVERDSPKVHRCTLHGRTIFTISLISPSSAANRAIGATRLYKKRKQENSHYSPFAYRLEQYRRVFLELDSHF